MVSQIFELLLLKKKTTHQNYSMWQLFVVVFFTYNSRAKIRLKYFSQVPK